MAAVSNKGDTTGDSQKIYVVDNHILDSDVHHTLEYIASNVVDASVHQALQNSTDTSDNNNTTTINAEALIPSTSHPLDSAAETIIPAEEREEQEMTTPTTSSNPTVGMRRQVTFCIGVQTDISQTNSVFSPLSPGETPVGTPRDIPADPAGETTSKLFVLLL